MAADRYPIIDRGKCVGCGRCLNICEEKVFRFGLFSTRPKVAHPDRCQDGCDRCVRMCPAQAIYLKNGV